MERKAERRTLDPEAIKRNREVKRALVSGSSFEESRNKRKKYIDDLIREEENEQQ